ncbi:MAG: hypothetical protein WC836_20080 [Desulfobacula sp.]|jgi:hypothetical protein
MEITRTIDLILRQLPEKKRFLSVIFILIATIIAGHIPEAAVAEDAKHSSAMTGLQILKGSWVRPDGGYIIKIDGIDQSGKVSASYFNPQPINVFQAVVTKKKDRVILVVELRDINYPGSKYYLQYDLETDTLKGTYYQAVEKQTFDVVFMRNR